MLVREVGLARIQKEVRFRKVDIKNMQTSFILFSFEKEYIIR